MNALALHHRQYAQEVVVAGETIQDRLRKQMRADALSTPTERYQHNDEDEESCVGSMIAVVSGKDKEKEKPLELNQEYDSDFLEEAVQFLRLQVCILLNGVSAAH